ncbi:hypothetical protein [Xanthomonas massiliensis]|uniref:hypothetical protein n=1 Tax=Xanthomonas massiliensis TaxID=1720302 RepID=UPI0013662909|nr:hypothetical protein [Xanthomonas massiliensis]
MNNVKLRIAMLACIALVVTACATGQYSASSSMVQVGPSKGWYKPGVTGKDAYSMWQRCISEAKEQPGYFDAKRVADSVPEIKRISERTREDRRNMFADGVFIGKYSDACMKNAGYKYMKYPPGESVYVPPPPPRKGWMKLGSSYIEASDIKSKCLRQEHSQEYLNKCMGEQGFVYRELTKDEFPPCWYVGGFDQCKDEPPPNR